jgi:hypothetical protein
MVFFSYRKSEYFWREVEFIISNDVIDVYFASMHFIFRIGPAFSVAQEASFAST